MPQLGETVTEGTITRWLKQVGDQIGQDEVLFEVSTDKVDSEVPSPSAGYLAEILVAEGDTVDVGARLAVITPDPPAESDGGGADDAAAAQPPRAAETEQAPAAETEQAPAPAPEAPEPARAPEPRPAPEPQPEPVAATPATAPASPAQAPTDGQGGDGQGGGDKGGGQVLSPVVRRLLAEHDLDPSQIRGTGAGDRITRADVLAVIDARSGGGGAPTRPAPAKPTTPAAPSAPAPPAAPTPPPGQPPVVTAPAGERDEVIPFSNIRRRTAEHMVRSKATSAHTLVAIEADFEGIDRVRRAQRERFRAEEGISLTYLPFVARATIEALRAFPHLNASVGDDSL